MPIFAREQLKFSYATRGGANTESDLRMSESFSLDKRLLHASMAIFAADEIPEYHREIADTAGLTPADASRVKTAGALAALVLVTIENGSLASAGAREREMLADASEKFAYSMSEHFRGVRTEVLTATMEARKLLDKVAFHVRRGQLKEAQEKAAAALLAAYETPWGHPDAVD